MIFFSMYLREEWFEKNFKEGGKLSTSLALRLRQQLQLPEHIRRKNSFYVSVMFVNVNLVPVIVNSSIYSITESNI